MRLCGRPRFWVPCVLLLVTCGALSRIPGRDLPESALNLYPYLAHPTAPQWLLELRAASSFGALWIPVLCGVLAGLMFLTTERAMRRFWGRHGEGAAMLAGALVIACPSVEAFVRVEGGDLALISLVLSVFAGWVALGVGWRSTLSAGVIVAAAGALHPVGFLAASLSVVAATLRAQGGIVRGLLVTVLAVLGVVLWGQGVRVSPLPGVAELPVSVAADQLFSLPALLADTTARALFPTGYEGLNGHWPVWTGLLAWAGVAALMFVGLRGGRFVLASVLIGALALSVPFVVTAWVPGDPMVLVALAVPAAVLLGLGLARLGRFGALAGLGLSLGLLVVGFAEHQRRDEVFGDRRIMLDIPRRQILNSSLFAPDLEKDPLRLVLYLSDVKQGDPHVWAVEAALKNLMAVTPHEKALDPQRLDDLVRVPQAAPPDASEEVKAAIRNVAQFEEAVVEMATRWNGANKEAVLDSVVDEATFLAMDAVQYNTVIPRHPVAMRAIQGFGNFADREILLLLSRLGYVQKAVELRYALSQIGPRPDEQRALWSRSLFEAESFHEEPDYSLAFDAAGEAMAALRAGDARHALAQAVRGQILKIRGEDQAALDELTRAWSALASFERGMTESGHEYWILVEILVDRLELAKKLNSRFLSQAAADVDARLVKPLGFGIRRLPALWLGARAALVRGDTERAENLLDEARALRTSTLPERGDGPGGRIDFPRYRIEVRRLLKELKPAMAAELDAEIERIRFSEAG